MNTMRTMLLIALIAILSACVSCLSYKVMSEQMRTEAERGVSFKTLVQETDRYKGKTVILGGYIIETKPYAQETTMTVLQTPLVQGERPNTKARSEGGFVLSYEGYLDPEVYEKERMVTVAGKVVGRVVEGAGNCPKPCLKLEYRQIYLWPISEMGYTYQRSRYEDWGEAFPMDRVYY